MPCHESPIQSFGAPTTFPLKDGRTIEIRNGCVVDAETRYTLAGSREATAYLLEFADLTPEQREWIEYWGADVFGQMAVQSGRGAACMGYRLKKREAAA